jgi:hypothetical protein
MKSSRSAAVAKRLLIWLLKKQGLPQKRIKNDTLRSVGAKTAQAQASFIANALIAKKRLGCHPELLV